MSDSKQKIVEFVREFTSTVRELLPAYVAEWAIEMILWKARLRTTKPEKYPV